MIDKNQDITYTVKVPVGKAGQRLDSFLAKTLSEISRTRLKVLIDEGNVILEQDAPGSSALDPSRKVLENQVFLIKVPPPVSAIPEAQLIPLDIVYEDNNIFVINKAAGMVVHPAPGSPDGTLVNALLGHNLRLGDGSLSGIGGVERPGIVHRLDKGTSGLMVVAKNDVTHRLLSEQFSDRSIKRVYFALVWGVPNPTQGEISSNIGRSRINRKKMAVVRGGGKVALTHFKVVKSYGKAVSLVECRLGTGRTHQIRVHMASLGYPVIGDPLYGGGSKVKRQELSDSAHAEIKSLDHQVLHAKILGFVAKSGQEPLFFESNFPSYFSKLIDELDKM
jgi:23S rRNA pseudouridine1911/1915/1917 synthase